MFRQPTGKTAVFCTVGDGVREVGSYRSKWAANFRVRILSEAGIEAWTKPEMRILFSEVSH